MQISDDPTMDHVAEESCSGGDVINFEEANANDNKDFTPGKRRVTFQQASEQDTANAQRTTSKLIDHKHEFQTDSNRALHDFGDSVFSGTISYSGSVSLRSDSSTTSARSFAFPIMQSEWNSSPVRMAKAERRQLRKYKGWMEGCLCCRF